MLRRLNRLVCTLCWIFFLRLSVSVFFINACKNFILKHRPKKVQRSRSSIKILIFTLYSYQNIHFLLVWSSYTDLKFFYMQRIFVCLLLCVLAFFYCLVLLQFVEFIYLFQLLALNLIYPDENLKSMFAFMILIALFFPLVSIRCKLYIINKRQNLFTVHCTCISNIQLSITPTVHHHYYLMLFRISFCVK